MAGRGDKFAPHAVHLSKRNASPDLGHEELRGDPHVAGYCIDQGFLGVLAR